MHVQNRALLFPTSLLMDSGPIREGEVGKDLFSYKFIQIFLIRYGPFLHSCCQFSLALQHCLSPISLPCAAIPTWSNRTRARGEMQHLGATCPRTPLAEVLLPLLWAKHMSHSWRQCLLGMASEGRGGCSISEEQDTIMVLRILFCCLLQPPPWAEDPEEKDAYKSTEITVLSHNQAKSKF